MITYIRRQQHKNFKHQDIKQKEPTQKYRLGTISGGLKSILHGHNLTLSFRSGSDIGGSSQKFHYTHCLATTTACLSLQHLRYLRALGANFCTAMRIFKTQWRFEPLYPYYTGASLMTLPFIVMFFLIFCYLDEYTSNKKSILKLDSY